MSSIQKCSDAPNIARHYLADGDARATTLVRNACALLSRWVPHTIVCVAEAARRSHIRAGYDASRMMVIPNGFALPKLEAAKEQRDALRSSCGFGPDDLVIGNIGRFNANKDQRNFVRAAGPLARTGSRCWASAPMCLPAWLPWTSFAFHRAPRAFPMWSARQWPWPCLALSPIPAIRRCWWGRPAQWCPRKIARLLQKAWPVLRRCLPLRGSS